MVQTVKKSACNARDLGLISGSGQFPGEGNGYPLQYSCLENPHGQKNLLGYTHEGAELDTTEQLSMQGLNKQLQKFRDFSNNSKHHMAYGQNI